MRFRSGLAAAWRRAKAFLLLLGAFCCLATCSAHSSPTLMPTLTWSSLERLPTRTPTPSATAIVTPSPTPPPSYQDGLEAFNRGDFETALVYFDEALVYVSAAKNNPALAPLYASRAKALRLTDRHDAALVDAEMALTLDDTLADVWLVKALLHYDVQEWDLSLQTLSRLLALQPDTAQAYVLRAQIQERALDQPKQALADYTQAARLDHSLHQSLQAPRWRLLAKLDRWEEAVLLSAQMFLRGHPDPLRYYYHGIALARNGYFDLAISDLIQGIKRYPDYAGPFYYALGIAYASRGGWSESIEALQVALAEGVAAPHPTWDELEISGADVLGRMGVAYMELGECLTAGDLIERVVAESDNPAEWQWALDRLEICGVPPTPTPTLTPIPPRTPTPIPPPTPEPTAIPR